MNSVKKIMIITRTMPTEMGNSESIRLFRIIRMLAEKYNVYVYANNAQYGMASIKSLGVRYGLAEDFTQFESTLEGINPDLVIFSRWLMAENVIEVIRESSFAKIAIDIPNITFEQLEQRKDIAVEDFNTYKTNELDVYKQADFLIVTSNKSKEKLKETKKDIFVIPPIYTFDEFQRFTKNVEINNVYYIGDYKYHSNLDVLNWLYKELWGYIKNTSYDLKLHIFGNFCPPEYKDVADYNISVMGFVPEIESYLDKMAICLAPMRINSGYHGKIIEAIQHGIPVVTTSQVAKDMAELGIEGNRHLFIADTKKEIAEKINSIILDPPMAYEKAFKAKQALAKSLNSIDIKLNLYEMIEKEASKEDMIQGDWSEYD